MTLLREHIYLSWCKQPLQDGKGACQDASGVTRSFLGFSRYPSWIFCLPLCAWRDLHSSSSHWELLTCYISFWLNFFLCGTCCSPTRSEPWRASYKFGKQEVSLPREHREDPQGYTPYAASEYLRSPSKHLRQQPKWLGTTEVSAGKGCNDPLGPTKSWQHFPCNSPKHLAKKSVSYSSILPTKHRVLVKEKTKRHRSPLLTAQMLSEDS